ncbi:MAG: CotH kinase family protein [Flavobacteriales bacterium]
MISFNKYGFRADVALAFVLVFSVWVFYKSDFTEHTKKYRRLEKIPTSFKWQSPGHVGFINLEKRRLPKVYLEINPDDFFDYKTGIYIPGIESDKAMFRQNIAWWDIPANYHQRGNNWERYGTICFSDDTLKQQVKIRINGNATRAFSQKSLRIVPLDKKGQVWVNWNDKRGVAVIQHSAILRNGGNDWTKCLFRDALIQEIAQNLNLEIQPSQPFEIYINKTYWGIHNLRPRMDEKHLAAKYGVKKKAVTIIENNFILDAGSQDLLNDFKAAIEMIQNPAEKWYSWEMIEKDINTLSFVDYLLTETFFANTDWPKNNFKVYAIQYKDSVGKWEFILNDLDYGFGYTGLKEAIKKNMFAHINSSKNTPVKMLWNGLLQHTEFRNLVWQRWNYLKTNEFSEAAVVSKIDEYQNRYAPHMSRHINRWRKIGSCQNWLQNVEELRVFVRQRHSYFENHLKSALMITS